MHLKITSPQTQIFEWSIEKVTIPTEAGEITVLPNHQPLASVVKAGLVKIFPSQLPEDEEYVIDQWVITISVSKWMVFVDGTNVILTTTAATKSPEESEEVLAKMKEEMEIELEKIRVEWNEEDIEQAIINLEKVTADLRLAKLGKVNS